MAIISLALNRAIENSHVATRARVFEPACGTPYVEEDLIDEIVDDRRVAGQALDEAGYPFPVTGEDDVHGCLVALRNILEQQLVADIFLHKATIDFPIARCARRSRFRPANGVNQPAIAYGVGRAMLRLPIVD